MNLFELSVKISADTSKAEKGMKSTQVVSETLTNKIKVLSAQFEAAQKNVDKLTKEFNESVNKAGATDKATQELANKLADAEKEAGKFAKELNAVQKEAEQSEKALDGCNEEIEDTGEKAEKSGNSLANFAGKLGKGLATAAKIGTAAVGAAATGITALTTAAVNNYAEYEQLVGGAKLMFGNAYETVAKNAQDAYKTVQMSQNEYLQQVNGFATGLKTALGGNEQAAAELAHNIVKAEADIVAATGNTSENVQNAFNGIMKSNFTMLDNLQIGITPTKEGFQEVIDKVNEWNKANGEATNYQMGNLADMQSALVDYIDMVGMSGYAQREASETITGSISSMKSAWSNLLTGLADDSADLESLVNSLVDSITGYTDESGNRVKGVVDNIFPVIKASLNGIGKLIKEVFPVAMQYIPQIIGKFLPTIADSAVGIVSSIANAILENLDQILDMGINIVEYLKNGIIENMPTIMESASEIVNTLSEKIIELSGVLAEAAYELVDALGNELSEQIPGLSVVFENLETVVISLTAAMVAYKTASAISGVIDTIRKATEGQTIAQTLLNAVMNANPFVLVTTLIVGLVAAIVTLWNTNEGFRNAVISAWESIKSAAGTIFTAIANFFTETIPNAFQSMIDWISNGISSFVDIGYQIVDSIMSGISAAWDGLVSWFNGIWNSLFGGRSVDVNVNANATSDGVNGSHAGGLNYVPFDGYIAELHKGERVLTADEARRYNNRSNSGYDERPIKIVVQSVLDGKVIGETAYNYNRRKERACGI